MAKKRKAEPQDKRKPVNVRPIERKHSGKIVEPYRIMEELIPKYHPELEGATILLCYRRGWKPDVDRVLTLARIKKASDLDRALGSRFGDSYDFVMLLNEDSWIDLSDDDKRMVIDHELCHAKPDLDRDGQQKLDVRERLCWRTRKHPIQEFPEIIDRYGIEAALGMNATATAAAEKAEMPLFADQVTEDIKADAKDNGKASARQLAAMPIEKLQDYSPDVSDRQITLLQDAGLDHVGDLIKHMQAQAEWWHKGVPGIGAGRKTGIEDAVAKIQKAGG